MAGTRDSVEIARDSEWIRRKLGTDAPERPDRPGVRQLWTIRALSLQDGAPASDRVRRAVAVMVKNKQAFKAGPYVTLPKGACDYPYWRSRIKTFLQNAGKGGAGTPDVCAALANPETGMAAGTMGRLVRDMVKEGKLERIGGGPTSKVRIPRVTSAPTPEPVKRPPPSKDPAAKVRDPAAEARAMARPRSSSRSTDYSRADRVPRRSAPPLVKKKAPAPAPTPKPAAPPAPDLAEKVSLTKKGKDAVSAAMKAGASTPTSRVRLNPAYRAKFERLFSEMLDGYVPAGVLERMVDDLNEDVPPFSPEVAALAKRLTDTIFSDIETQQEQQ